MSNEITVRRDKPVFSDEKGRRGKYFSSVSILLAIVATALVAFFVVSVLINPFLPQIRLKQIAALPQQSDLPPHLPELPVLSKRDALAKQTADKVRVEKEKRATKSVCK